jgi:hypothetical protein
MICEIDFSESNKDKQDQNKNISFLSNYNYLKKLCCKNSQKTSTLNKNLEFLKEDV